MTLTDSPSLRFPKTDRILERDVFRRVYDRGRKVETRHFTAFVLERPGGSTRLGLTVTKKIGNSVERNRARRRMREAFRRIKWNVPEGLDIVINARRSILEVAQRDLETDLVRVLERFRSK